MAVLILIDHAYVLAFSLMMLHTDVFNKNNKNKMSKADYTKNTRLDGIPPIVLEVRPTSLGLFVPQLTLCFFRSFTTISPTRLLYIQTRMPPPPRPYSRTRARLRAHRL